MPTDWIALTCECFLDEELVRMDVHELSHRGFFGATTAAPELGQELSVRLVGGAASRPVLARVVVESHVAPGARGAGSPAGIRFRLLRFSREYGLLLTGDSPSEDTHKPDEQLARSTKHGRARDEQEWLANVLSEENETPRSDPLPEQEWPEWEEYEPLWERAGVPLWSEDSEAPEATIIDDGELDDVVRVLSELGVKTERPSPDQDALITNWIRPRSLLVVTAKRALTLGLPLRSGGQGFVSIAVSDSDAQMVSSGLRHLGYQFVISRPIHPLAMSMLFRQAIFPDHEQRVIPREVLGCSVYWWCGWARKQPGVLMDVSSAGCQLLIEGGAENGARIKIRVPGAVVGDRDFTLVGQVIRATRRDGGTSLGISFDDLSAKVQRTLQKLLTRPGPCRLLGEPLMVNGDATLSNSDEAERDATPRNRRLNYRALIRQEVVALEYNSSDVKHVLMSSDLTVDGMRVEPHPSLVMGEQMDLALYEESNRSALILSAVTERDDGRSGWWLRFIGVTPEIHERLIGILDRSPPVTQLARPESEQGRVVFTQVLEQAKPPGEDELA